MSEPFVPPIAFDLAATSLMAITGVWVASRRGYDAVGAFTLAFVSALGGGLLRDAILLNQMPAALKDPRYIVAVLAAVLVGSVFHRFARQFGRLVASVDAMALGCYVVVGADKALGEGVPAIGAMFVGMTNAVGGGLLRDILVRDEPLVFKPGQLYVLAALSGCAAFIMLQRVHAVPPEYVPWIAIGITLALRLLAIRFNWTTTPVSNWARKGGTGTARPGSPPDAPTHTSTHSGE